MPPYMPAGAGAAQQNISPTAKDPSGIIDCPECDTPALVLSRAYLPSTDGRIEFVKIQCSNEHWFLLPAEDNQWICGMGR